MADGAHLATWFAPLVAAAVLGVGGYAAAVVDRIVSARLAHLPVRWRSSLTDPARATAQAVMRQQLATEHPDRLLWRVAPAGLVGLAALGACVVPLSATVSIADLPAGIVVWGAVEALAIVAVFVSGWAPNSLQPLIAGYRYIAVGFSVLLLSMFVLIAAAVPAGSLSVRAIVADQAGLWNLVRQPLGLPLFLVVALGITSSGPLDLAASAELGGGVTAELSGVRALAWAVGRSVLLVSFAGMGAAVFLGGWLGPWLPGPVWMAAKTLAMLTVLVTIGHTVAIVRAERMLTLCWTVLLPLAFVDLAIAGLGSL